MTTSEFAASLALKICFETLLELDTLTPESLEKLCKEYEDKLPDLVEEIRLSAAAPQGEQKT